MSTKKPISPISFNTEMFLHGVCRDLVGSGLIQSFIFIMHYAEKDTTKDHFHLLLCPSRPVEPMRIRAAFRELCPGKPDLGCLPFQPSKISDWLLYALHFPPYLFRKGLVRVNSYQLADFVTNEPPEWLAQLFHDASEEVVDTRISLFVSEIENGATWGELLARGFVPPNQVVFYEKLFKSNQWRQGRSLDNEGNYQIPF